jgi:ethanolamine utilization microcompartment shell protein EutS
MSDAFKNERFSREMPAIGALAVTPSNDNDLAQTIRAVTIGGAGTISFISSVDGATYTTGTLPVGTYALSASRIRATGTTATDITGWV